MLPVFRGTEMSISVCNAGKGVSPTYIYQLEQGLKSPTVEYLGYICAGLNISLAEFFAEEQSEKNVTGRTTDALNEKQKRLLDEFLSSL